MRWRGTQQENGNLILVFDIDGKRVEKRANRVDLDQELFKKVKVVLSKTIEQHFTKH